MSEMDRLRQIMSRLRGPEGCPWDREQTYETLRTFLVEETYEVLEAIASGTPRALCEELGDLLIQIVFLAQVAEERGDFD
ncbi:MAG TPA: MazG nucleotide pyrophosphohydrolase domain-containing protein, partial [Candidatus Polarisedimenticolia bacterium]|nr:MazG nucleotide pyrophosphohydrolase domain-containing protein [Candidatus Polarisedimenticolia bacterium]